MNVGRLPAVTVRPARRVCGQVRCPGDKSISHRYAILAALADGASRIEHYAAGADCAATLGCLGNLGVDVTHREPSPRGPDDNGCGPIVEIVGRGLRGLSAPSVALDARNSGTTLRLLAGVLAAHRFEATLTGDSSLLRRPMRRLIEPLERMGARVRSAGDRPPLTIAGADLRGIDYAAHVPSAQVKSGVLLAALQASGSTRVQEPVPTRDHTERALRAFGVTVDQAGDRMTVRGGQRLQGMSLRVPGDVSSAAFLAAAAAALPGSDIELVDIGLNPTRTALLDVLRRLGARVDVVVDRQDAGEPAGRLRIRHGRVSPMTIAPGEVAGLIDELPVLAALATHGGEISVTGAAELRMKESDRIAALVSGLRGLGADAVEWPDGFHVRGTTRLPGGTADAAGDHRLAMAFAIAALGAEAPCRITGAGAVDVSYPGFFDVLESICE